ncbi:regulation of nuclear pre-mRNA domain-containing protein 2 [Esox lucius]|uniref:regulation of nuclear pre-mRNA domain-containing protein 2 n=1 Tax=Esox lucius TaxID=8010 RepID=UPI0014776A4F|nr:regulation of nuclear pre-mRNA domain-containing protein 2 [Esox lucius]
MAAGSGAASGHGGRGALEATLDRRFQGVSNTMESIQGLSTWCIENKKYHSLIVRYWMKWLKKSDTNHRLNLFYLANDVIQNCKRKNAIVFRSAFAEVLPNAALMVKDPKVRKSVERIFTIWEERNVYPEEVITQLKANLTRKEREREKEKEKEKAKETPPPPAPVNPKAALKSKIVADFIPQSFIEQLAGYKRSGEEEELRETQLTALRVDVCSTEALKRLKDKAGGNKFAKDFEEGSLKLQEFVTFLENQMTVGPPLLEALGNADVFYEMQYKEVKIVANAYKTFANRVINLKRKLDTLKSSLPGPEDSPIPSPSEDAPSPTGSDSPFLGTGGGRGERLGFDPDLDGSAMEEGDVGVVRAGDNRDVEDMELSEEDTDKTDEKPFSESTVLKATTSKPPAKPAPVTPIPTSNDSPLKKTTPSTPSMVTPSTPTSTGVTAPSGPSAPLGVNLANVDLGKISSILSSITSAMKNTASPVSRPSPGTPTTPSGQSSSSKNPVGPTPPSPALASILSRVNVTPEGIFNVLSKTHTQGLSSLLRSGSSSSASTSHSPPDSSAAKGPPTPTTPSQTKPAQSVSLKRETPERSRGARDWEKNRETSPPPPPPPQPLGLSSQS